MVIDCHHSSSSTVLSGVPQGTVLVPVLFNTIYAWADRVNMEFNGDKFECLQCWPHQDKLDLISNHHYNGPAGLDIGEPTEVKDLGVLFSPDIYFKAHADTTIKQVNNSLAGFSGHFE